MTPLHERKHSITVILKKNEEKRIGNTQQSKRIVEDRL